MLSPAVASFMQKNWGLMLACCIGACVLSCVMICCVQLTRKVPVNYALLFLFTVMEAYMVAACAAVSKPEIVMAAAASTAAIVLGITVYAWRTKTDFTICGPAIIILSLAMCMTSLFIFAFKWPYMHMIYCCIAVIVFSFYLIFDTQLIMGGKRY